MGRIESCANDGPPVWALNVSASGFTKSQKLIYCCECLSKETQALYVEVVMAESVLEFVRQVTHLTIAQS
jgi:hypothetical protein